MAPDDLSSDLRLDLDGFISGAGPDFVQINRNVFVNYFCNKHRSHWRLRRLPRFDSPLQRARNRERRENDEKENAPTRNSLLFVPGDFHSPSLLNFRGGSIP